MRAVPLPVQELAEPTRKKYQHVFAVFARIWKEDEEEEEEEEEANAFRRTRRCFSGIRTKERVLYSLDFLRLELSDQLKESESAKIFAITFWRGPKDFSELGGIHIQRDRRITIHDEVDVRIVEVLICHISRRQKPAFMKIANCRRCGSIGGR